MPGFNATIPLPTNSLKYLLGNKWVRFNLMEPTRPPKAGGHEGELGPVDTRTCQEV